MRYLFIIGCSGCGKTTLAEKLESLRPRKFNRLVQYTARPMRHTESEGIEYNFITQDKFNELDATGKLTAVVKEEFAPAYYGTPIDNLKLTKINIVVVSIEGLLDALNKLEEKDTAHVLFIYDVAIPEGKREARCFFQEEKYSSIVLNKLAKRVNLIKITHAQLKEIRNEDAGLLKFIKENNV